MNIVAHKKCSRTHLPMQSNQESPLPRSRQRLFEIILVSASLLVGYLVVEFAYRGYLYYTYAVRADYAVMTIDARYPSPPLDIPGNIRGPNPISSVLTYTQYDAGDHIVQRHRIKTNNLGWVSHHD